MVVVKPASWSAITYEQREWTPSGVAVVPRRQRAAELGGYEAAVTPLITSVVHLEISTDTLALADEASVEIARFDAEIGRELAPFGSLLLRSESAASSRIEQLTASAKAIALAELGDPSQRNANVIVANTRAMSTAIALADRLDEQSILDVHEALLGATHPEWVGRWRGEQVWIGGTAYSPHRAAFVPPHHDRVPAAMADLVAFMARDDLPALVQAAIAHAQFETIHPFPDGNGRTGRSLVQALLRSKRLTRSVTVPVSAGLLTDTDGYFGSLTAYREGRPGEIVERMATAAFHAVGNGRELVGDLERIRIGWGGRITARRGSTAWRVAEHLVRQPVVDSPLLQRELEVSAPAVNGAIDHLAELGILTRVSGQHRNRKWAATEVLGALDAFAARTGRRS